MTNLGFRLTLVLMLALYGPVGWSSADILFIRHGEKPPAGLGQLNCRGLNRALALPRVIAERFGRPDFILAPDPAHKKADYGVPFSYVRPLATVEPTAIYFGLPVDTSLGFDDVDGIQALLERLAAGPGHRRILVAWEHVVAQQIVQALLRAHGATETVPRWHSDDFDSIYIVSLSDSGSAAFRRERQMLDALPQQCPDTQRQHHAP